MKTKYFFMLIIALLNLKSFAVGSIEAKDDTGYFKTLLQDSGSFVVRTSVKKSIEINKGYALTENDENVTSLESKTIDLSNKNLVDVPEYVFSNIEIEELKLNNNDISKLPADIRKLYNLKILDLSSTNITELPEEIHQLLQLTEIHLPYNNFIFKLNDVKKFTRAKIILE